MAAPKGTSAEKVTISKVSSDPFILTIKKSGSQLKVENQIAVVCVKAPPAVTTAAVDLVLVVDVSYNNTDWNAALSSEKSSSLDVLKKALRFVISQLKDGDRLTIVFNDNYYTKNFIISDETRKLAKKEVDLCEKAGTSFKPGLDIAIEQISKKQVGMQSCLILLSDGLDKSKFKGNDGKSPAGKKQHLKKLFGARNCPVHTFGLCRGHDPKELLLIADESNGTYSSITENLGRNIIEALAICLGGLKTVVAVGTNITITVSDGGGNWWPKIKCIEPYGNKCHNDLGEKEYCNIEIGTLYAGEVKEFVIRFNVTFSMYLAGKQTLCPLTARGEYASPPGIAEHNSSEFLISVSVSSPENPSLPLPMVRIKVLKFLEDYLKSLKEDVGATQEDAGKELMDRWEKEKAQKDGLDLKLMEDDIKAMASSLNRGLGVGCVYSWVSSYKMQRATTTGMPGTAFLTPAMSAMVLEVEAQMKMEEEIQTEGMMQEAENEEHVIKPKQIEDRLDQLYSKIHKMEQEAKQKWMVQETLMEHSRIKLEMEQSLDLLLKHKLERLSKSANDDAEPGTSNQ